MNLYSLEINIRKCYFADNGAKALSIGIKKLNNLHILHLTYSEMIRKIYSRLT